jgi:predicted enzyme related to lactoylglutathione lyase
MTRNTNPLARHGGLSYLEIPALDPGTSAAFYEQVVGWKIEQRAPGDVRFSDAAGLLIGRWVTGRASDPTAEDPRPAGEAGVPTPRARPPIAREAGFCPVIYVEGLDAAAARVEAAGGEMIQPPHAEGDVRVARVRDPAGNALGLWEFAGG